ncbi:hypothetical protein SISNIDRAFT_356830 [Sistotremastrum niveocremeum HHB9708]|uniref:Uncharacterized protein n=1 Tax=Sistotremastrum niveocremeum HHB9708 TaxID=1314777 RepID=A0A164WJC1_9AGAM|nr:hypothetical protein SISNIDRAFT_356830 [Sistotremastrum niveocremeum HHB9708]
MRKPVIAAPISCALVGLSRMRSQILASAKLPWGSRPKVPSQNFISGETYYRLEGDRSRIRYYKTNHPRPYQSTFQIEVQDYYSGGSSLFGWHPLCIMSLLPILAIGGFRYDLASNVVLPWPVSI